MKARVLFGLLASVLLAGCGDSLRPAPAEPGVMSLVFDAPDDSTGSIVVTVSGATVDSIVPTGDGVYGSASGSTALFTGTLVRGAVIGAVYVSDMQTAGAITAVVDEAASAPANDQRPASTVSVRLLP